MELIRRLSAVREVRRGCVASIGNFDGVHLGHQSLLSALKAGAAALGVPSTVIVFEPQPREFFQREGAPARLMRLSEKLLVLAEHGVDRVVCLRFDATFADLAPAEFVERVLVRGIGVRRLIIGQDFRFGRGRAGDYDYLAAAGRRHGFQVVGAPLVQSDGSRVSSTRVRDALARGAFRSVRQLLGRDYAIYGRIVHGSERGRDLGFATLNIPLRRHRAPLDGIFVARVAGLAAQPLPAVAYIGRRPAGTALQLEAHCLDFAEQCYGRHASVALLAKLREDREFDSIEAMKAQIALDAEAARQAFECERARQRATA